MSFWRKRRREVPLDSRPVPGEGAPGDGTSTGPREVTAVTALARLPQRQREVVALRIFLDLDTARSTVAVNINPSALPAGAGVWIDVIPETRTGSGTVQSFMSGMRAMLIYASGHCPAPGGG